MAAMKKAEQALDKALADADQNKPPQPPNDNQQTQNQPHDNLMGEFKLGHFRTVKEAGWDVTLPPKNRADVEQALRTKMPDKYARQIKLYYQNLAGAKTE